MDKAKFDKLYALLNELDTARSAIQDEIQALSGFNVVLSTTEALSLRHFDRILSNLSHDIRGVDDGLRIR